MLNKVTLIGRLGRDPETRYMPNGDTVCNFSVATDESWKDAQGNRQERTEWHNITMYRRLAEIAAQYLKKGSLVYIEGRIQSRKYTGKVGSITVSLKIKAKGNSGQIEITPTIKAVVPEHERGNVLMFATPEGNLQLEDPRQQKLELKDAPEPKPLKFAKQ